MEEMKDIINKTSKEIIELIKRRDISCKELMELCLEQVKAYDPVLEAFISLHNEETLLGQATESDKRRSLNKQKSLIDGIPIAVKDNIHSEGIPTTCASKILQGYNPPYNATVISAIKQNGGIVIGKTNLDEFAMGSTCENSSLKQTKNPWNLSRVPGGSSGGSAAAVSSGMAPLALGSDTGGSIRQPASFCGITGMKPTYGLVSRYGLVAYASSLDQIGPLSRDVYGNALLLNIICRHDKNDSTSINCKNRDYISNLDRDIKGTKIAVFPPLFAEEISKQIYEEFKESLETFKKLGAIIEEVDFTLLKYVVPTYYFIASAEACSNLSRYDGVKYGFRSSCQNDYREMLITTRSQGFGKEVKKRILLGNFVLSEGYYDEYYLKAQRMRAHLKEELKKIFQSHDAIAMPTTTGTAFQTGESQKDPMKIYQSDVTTVLPNLAGLPAISVPSGIVDEMPAGLQIIGKPLAEDKLFQIAYAFEALQMKNFIPPMRYNK